MRAVTRRANPGGLRGGSVFARGSLLSPDGCVLDQVWELPVPPARALHTRETVFRNTLKRIGSGLF